MRYGLLIILLLAGCERAPAVKILTGEAMGTTYRVKYVGDVDEPDFQPLLDRLDRDLSTWRDDSWVSRFNLVSAGEEMEMPASVAELMTISQELQAQTGGRFDPAIGALIKVWGFGAWRSEFQGEPTDTEVEAARENSGLRLLMIEGLKLSKRRDGVMLDFSAIAKGYAVDLMATQLQESGCEDFLIEFGGDLLARGGAPGKTGWTVGGSTLGEPVTLRNEAIATSGSSHQSRGTSSHIIDPTLGRPVAVGESVSARAPTCAEADALATAAVIGSQTTRGF